MHGPDQNRSSLLNQYTMSQQNLEANSRISLGAAVEAKQQKTQSSIEHLDGADKQANHDLRGGAGGSRFAMLNLRG